jgi:hypothetical protein
MKSLTHLLFLFSVLSFAGVSSADNQACQDNALLLNVGGIPLGALEIQYQHRLNPRVTLIIPVEVDYRHILVTENYLDPNIKDNFIAALGLGAKVHLWGESLKHGVYVSPLVQAGYLAPLGALSSGTGVVRSSFSFGFDWIADFGFMLDVNVGLAHNYVFAANRVSQNAAMASNPSTFFPAMRLLLGYAW